MALLETAIGAGASLAGGLINARATRQANNANMQMQREFATSGIRMRVADANAAGIHPIYALGAPTMSPSVQVQANTGLGDAMGQMGQNISRAASAVTTIDEKQAQLLDTQIEHQRLQNQMLGIQIGDLLYPKPTIPLPDNSEISGRIPGQGDWGYGNVPGLDYKSLVEWQKPKSTIRGPGSPSRGFGDYPDVDIARTSTGWGYVPSQDVKNRIEDIGVEDIAWSVRNRFLPSIFNTPPTPPPAEIQVPKGKYWHYNRWMNEWQFRDKKKKYY